MAARPSLPTLLSQVLVAFTIELDNEAERRIAEAGSPPRFLVSLAMWSNYLRFVGEDGLSVHELKTLAGDSAGGIRGRLSGLSRWGYVRVAPAPVPGERLVRVTAAGRRAQEVWRPLVDEVEQRWRTRFGREPVEHLRATLEASARDLVPGLPQYLPVLSYADGMRAPAPQRDGPADIDGAGGSALALPTLLSRVLLGITLEYERASELSLAIGANVLRVLDDEGVRVRDLPGRTGVSKEAVGASVGFLQRHGYAVVEPDPAASRGKRVRLTAKGGAAREADARRLDIVQRRGAGRDRLDRLRGSLGWFLDRPEGEPPRLSEGLRPYPDGWRARSPYARRTAAMIGDPAAALPHHPMVLHRGGWPDGS